MKVRWLSIALVFGLLLSALVAPASAQSQTSGLVAKVEADVPNSLGGIDAFKGTLTIAGFDKQGTDLVANVVLDGDVSDPSSTVIGNIRRFAATTPAPTVRASCERLDVELYKVSVKTSGFEIKLDRVAFGLSIKDYREKKVGKLLCNLSKKLENGNPPSAIANELNHILREIGG